MTTTKTEERIQKMAKTMAKATAKLAKTDPELAWRIGEMLREEAERMRKAGKSGGPTPD